MVEPKKKGRQERSMTRCMYRRLRRRGGGGKIGVACPLLFGKRFWKAGRDQFFLEYTKKFQGERFLPLSYRLLGCWMMAHVVAQQGAQNNMNLGKQKMIYVEK